MTALPPWVAGLPDAEIARHFGTTTVERGRTYQRDGRVGRLQTSGDLVMARVRGSAGETYQASVVKRGAGPLVATCTCPMRRDCKHAVAVLEQARAQSGETGGWQSALRPLLAGARPTAAGLPAGARTGGAGGDEVALQLNETGFGLTLRPLKKGRRHAWVKAGASWDDVRERPATFAAGQREVLLGLIRARERSGYAYGYRPDALPLDELPAEVWDLLAQAREHGIPLLSGTDARRAPLPPASMPGPFEPTVLVRHGEDGLEVTPTVVGPDGVALAPPRSAFLGHPAHGLALRLDDRLLLGPLTTPLGDAEHDLFVRSGSISEPSAEAGLFTNAYLPELRRRFSVSVADDLDVPEPSPPTLICRVVIGRRHATVGWGWRYRIGERSYDLGLARAATDPPVRDEAAEARLVAALPHGPWTFETADGRADLRPAFLTGRALFGFIADVLPRLAALEGVEVVRNGEAPTYREAAAAPRIELAVTDAPTGDWFNLDVTVTIDGEPVPFAELFTALAVGDDHLLLDTGTWFSLDHPELDQLRAIIEEARQLVDRDGDTLHLRPEQAGLWEELVSLGVVAEQSAAWNEAVTALLDADALPEAALPQRLQAQLRPYQEVGYRWLRFLYASRLGGILADEMGLGKTVQALGLAQALHEEGELTRPMLVVAPTSVLGTWEHEAATFAPDLKVVAVTETQKRRGGTVTERAAGADIVLTSYTLLRLEAEQYAEQDWSIVLLDEAQFVKNRAAQAHKAVRKLRARSKIALTGTPLENNLMDLWSLLSITAPGLFPDPKAFTTVFRKPIEDGNADALARLHRRIRPLILRRTKGAVAAELPDKQEQVVSVELSPQHRRLYDRYLARERQKVLGLVDDLARNRITILRSLTLLRQLCLAPKLIDEELPGASAKIDTLIESLTEVIAGGHRALVFSQFTGFLGLVRKRLEEEGIAYEYLDGRTRDRGARIASFREGDAPVFLISLKAGGFGLTLTEADYVFILDPWWNPAAENQAIDRTHRIGQDKPVNVYRLVAADTIEEKVIALQQRKRHLFDQVVGTGSDAAAPLSGDDIRGLLAADEDAA